MGPNGRCARKLARDDVSRGGTADAEVEDTRGRIDQPQPCLEASDVGRLGPTGANALHGAVAEGHVEEWRRTVVREHADVLVTEGGARQQHSSHQRGRCSMVRPPTAQKKMLTFLARSTF